MNEIATLSPELSRGVSSLARALVTAARSVGRPIPYADVEAVDPDAVQIDPLSHL